MGRIQNGIYADKLMAWSVGEDDAGACGALENALEKKCSGRPQQVLGLRVHAWMVSPSCAVSKASRPSAALASMSLDICVSTIRPLFNLARWATRSV